MDISQITPHLYVSAQPAPGDVPALCGLNIGLVINMRAESRPHACFGEPPLASLWLRSYDFILLPIPLPLLEQGVRAALPVIAQDRRVLVHCRQGVHRSVAMAAAILIAQGHSAAEAMGLLRRQRPAADPGAWHIRRQILGFERRWRAAHDGQADQTLAHIAERP